MQRRLYWHAVLLVLLGLLIGIGIPAFRNPRMGLTAHVGTLMSGLLLGLVGVCWPALRTSVREADRIFWLGLVSSYLNSAGLVLAAVFGTRRSTPIAGAGFGGTPLEELVVDVVLVGGAVPTLVLCVLLLRGLGGRHAGGAPPPA